MLEAIITEAARARLVRAVAGLLIALTAEQVKCDDAAVPVPDAHATATSSGGVVPPVKDRGAAEAQEAAKLLVNGLKVEGVGNHPKVGITPTEIQALADAEYGKLSEAGGAKKLSIAQLQAVADKITERYKKAGFIVAKAFVPAQTLGDDKIVQLAVLEGSIGKVVVKGAKRYRPQVIAAPLERLKGKPLLKDDVDSALLYVRDLPGLSASAAFQPGEKTGDTDLVVLVNEARRPYQITVGGNNYGTAFTGRYRGQLGVVWNSPLGFGDQFSGRAEYAFDPSNNVYGEINYRAPIDVVPGLALLVGANRSELQVNGGSFSALDIKGPTASYFGGAEWKFVNQVDLQVRTQLLYLYEQSKLDSLGTSLANEQFQVANLKFSINRTDRRFNGVDLLEIGVRKSVVDDTSATDLVSPNHAHTFVSGQLSYTRLQFLTKSQRLFAKLGGQYTGDALIPLEQFAIGGPDSVRAYPVADALRDRGYYTSLEYHVDAPGFGNLNSPFYGRPWRELLEFEAFVDYAKGTSAGANRQSGGGGASELSGVGAGVIFRLPKFYQFLFHLDGAEQLSSVNASDGHDYHIYGTFSFTF